MEVNVKVTVELGPNTIAALTGGLVASAPAQAAPAKKMAVVKDAPAAEETTEEEAPKAAAPKTASPAPKAANPAPAAKAAAPKPTPAKAAAPKEFGDMSEEDQLENLKAHVTKHTKKGKSADIKALLSNFGAGRASELTPDQYGDFNDAISRYSAGESVEDIFPSLD